jgi:hypothetical protein
MPVSRSGRALRSQRPKPRAGTGAPEAPPVAWRDPAALAALAVCLACIVVAVTNRIYDTDFWQHLLVGRAIWITHSLPHTNVWTWPTYGEPYRIPSWLFRVVLWPFYRIGELPGLYVWRWLTTIATFALLGATARRMGTRGLAWLFAIVWCALLYRQRTQVRPETLVGVLLAAQLFVLEGRRGGGPDRTWAVVLIAWIWANAHISYYLGPALTGFYWLDDVWRARRERRHSDRRLLLVGALSLGISFVHPYGWRALAEPFQYAFGQREAIFGTIGELGPIEWRQNLRNGLAVFLVVVPLLAVWRWRRHRFDVAQALLLAALVPQALVSQRFLGPMVLALTPFFARDLDAWIGSRRWPAWTRPQSMRAALVSAACVVATAIEVAGPPFRPGMGLEWQFYPKRACDYMAANGVRGRGFNPFASGGYLLWRFWPERDRLPFMDIHQTGTPIDRDLHAAAFVDAEAWRELDLRHRFEWVVAPSLQIRGQHLLDFLDADTTFSLVCLDDAAALYLRRSGAFAPLVARDGYRLLTAGPAGLAALGAQVDADSSLRAELRRELEREAQSSPWTSNAHSLLANLALSDGRPEAARLALERAREMNPAVPRIHERLGLVALAENRPQDALREFQAEHPVTVTTAMNLGLAEAAQGRTDRARAAYRRALRIDPGFAPAQDSLAALESR